MKIVIPKIRLPRIFRNFYTGSAMFFLLWMSFCDEDSFTRLYKNKSQLAKFQKEEAYYLKKIKEVEKDREELITNPELLEKYAREHYFMKKPTEDIYVVEEGEE